MFSRLHCSSGRNRSLDFKRRGGGAGLPVGREQNGQVVLVGHCREPFENVGEVGFGVVAVTTVVSPESLKLVGGWLAVSGV